MDDDFKLIQGAKGYTTRPDITATDEEFLVSGSQNVLINDQEKVESRDGYTLFGAENETRNRIKSERTWNTSTGTEIMQRESNGVLEYYSEVSGAWETLLTGLSTVYPVRFTEAWNSTELLDIQLFVNHSSTLYEWSGGQTTYSASTVNTITKAGATSWAEDRFLTAGTRTVRIKDTGGTWREFTYTGGESTTTLTGVSPDPTAFVFDADSLITQVVRTIATTPASGFINDVIGMLENHVYVGSHSSRRVYISKSTSYSDFTFSAPRIPTEGALLTMDDTTVGFKTSLTQDGKESMIIFSGKDRAYRVDFILSAGSTTDRETVRVKPIFVTSNQGAKSQELIEKIKNSIVFVSNDNELVDLGSLENFDSIQQNAVSDPVKTDFLAADFTNGVVKFWRNNLYITAPASSKMFILSFRVAADGGTRKFWQPPQNLEFGQLSDYGGLLYGHSGSRTESYLAFDGLNDNGQPIAFKAHFAYRNGGDRARLKNFDKYMSELYMTSNATVQHRIVYEYLGSKTFQEYVYEGSETDFLFVQNPNPSLGTAPLGTSPLGSSVVSTSDLIKYRRFKPITPVDHFEYQVTYECDAQDAKFQILAHGPNLKLSSNSQPKLVK